ncbi:MAG: hypothetical protein O3A95_03815 [Planctomycetota bacterium]|nr:hypothetical protein [Planctomycetota bacterium]MDA1113409.1 hypothetical protein [Planctomycetota bacterium]
MILIALLSLPLFQAQETVVAQPQVEAEVSAPTEREKWWSTLSTEERQEMRKRMEAMRSMSPEARLGLESRRKVFEQEKTFLLQQLSDEDRTVYESLDEREQVQFVRERVHERLRQRGDHLKKRFPGSEQGRNALEESRRQQVMEGIAKAMQEGWIGARAKQHFENAPLHEAMQALLEIQKWQFLEQAAESGFWKQNSVDWKQQQRISELPAQEFFREIRGLAEGLPQGPRWERREGRPQGPPPRDGKRRR